MKTSTAEFNDMLESAVDLTKECLAPSKKAKYFHPSVFIMYENNLLSVCMVEDGLPTQKRNRMQIMSQLGKQTTRKMSTEVKACFLAAVAEGEIGSKEKEVAVFVVGITPDGKRNNAVIRLEITPDKVLCAGVTEKNNFDGPLIKDAVQMLESFLKGRIKKRSSQEPSDQS